MVPPTGKPAGFPVKNIMTEENIISVRCPNCGQRMSLHSIGGSEYQCISCRTIQPIAASKEEPDQDTTTDNGSAYYNENEKSYSMMKYRIKDDGELEMKKITFTASELEDIWLHPDEYDDEKVECMNSLLRVLPVKYWPKQIRKGSYIVMITGFLKLTAFVVFIVFLLQYLAS